MDNDKTDHPDWTIDGQSAIYGELRKIFDAMCDALTRKDREAWEKLGVRFRELRRVAEKIMFS
jgi:hypothetical protein